MSCVQVYPMGGHRVQTRSAHRVTGPGLAVRVPFTHDARVETSPDSTVRRSLDRDRIPVLLVEGIHPRAVAAFRDEEGERSAQLARRVVWVGLLIVVIPLAYHSWDRYVESVARAELAKESRAWAREHLVRSVSLDRETDPAVVRIELVGVKEPPDPDVLARLVAEDLGRAVRVEILFSPTREGTAPAP